MSTKVVLGSKEYFPQIGKIHFEGRESKNPLAFKYYDETKIDGRQNHERILSFCNGLLAYTLRNWRRPIRPGTKNFPWFEGNDILSRGKNKMDAAFEFMTKIGIPFYCFHDIDLIDEGNSIAEYEKNLNAIVEYAKEKQKTSGIKLLWGTANVFSNPRYMNGASTNPDFQALCFAGTQVKNAIDATIKLGGEGYVFWGGREGYMSLLNTNMKREIEHLGKFLTIARDYGTQTRIQRMFSILNPNRWNQRNINMTLMQLL